MLALPRLRMLALLIIALPPALVEAGNLNLSQFSPADQSFSLSLPAEPVVHERKTWFPISRFVTRIYTSQVDGEEFGINYTQLPRLIGWLSSDRMILNSARDGMLGDSQATLVSLKKFKVRNQPAQAMVFSIPAQDGLPELMGQARLLMTGNRLYILWTETTPAVSDSSLAEFFASFRIGDWTPFAENAAPIKPPADEDPAAGHSPAPQ